MDDLEVLAAGVEDLEHVAILHKQLEQRSKVDFGFGVDRGRFVGACNLDQAKVRPIGILAHEFRVHGDKGLLREAVDKVSERLAVADQRMNFHLGNGHTDPNFRLPERVSN